MSNDMSQLRFWTEAYLVALARVDHKAALAEADAALEVCDARWERHSRRNTQVWAPVSSLPLGLIIPQPPGGAR